MGLETSAITNLPVRLFSRVTGVTANLDELARRGKGIFATHILGEALETASSKPEARRERFPPEPRKPARLRSGSERP
jgi:hypothetical protein